MELVNGSGGDLQATQVRDAQGRRHLVVVAKASYWIPPTPTASPAPCRPGQPVALQDSFEGEPGQSAVLQESDLAPFKPRCDVLLRACAHAPQGRPVVALPVAVQVGTLYKTFQVVGPRHWQVGALGRLHPSPPRAFVGQPIGYARAFGGSHPPPAEGEPPDVYRANPIGCGYGRGAARRRLEGQPLPTSQDPRHPISRPNGDYVPKAFGPLGRSWTPRVDHAGTYDRHWRKAIFPLPPPDLDPRYFQAAPPDQQMDYPVGGEEVVLFNLRPGGGLTRFHLPPLDLPLVVLLTDHRRVALKPVVDTLFIDADAGRFDLVWRARLPLEQGLHEVRTIAAGRICRRWWTARVYGRPDCGCGGVETGPEDMIVVSTDPEITL